MFFFFYFLRFEKVFFMIIFLIFIMSLIFLVIGINLSGDIIFFLGEIYCKSVFIE